MEPLDLWDMGRRTLAAQAFSRLLGTTLEAFSPGMAVLRIPIREDLLQQNGFVHGGVLSYAADNVLTFAAGTVLGAKILTSEYKINYLRPAVGESLVARGEVVHAGRRQAVCRCDIFVVNREGVETLCATAQGTIVATGADPESEEGGPS